MISTATASSPSASTIVATLEKQNNNKTIGTVSAGMTKGRNHKKMIPSQHKTEATGRRQHSPQSVTEIELDRAHSLDGGPIPLRRASYAFDLHGGQQRYRHHQKSSTPPYHHPHKHGPIMNGSLMNQQHSAQGNNSVAHHQDSSDCGSSSGLGGMGTPVKGESGCSISSSSNNSVIADCSHDSRDSGGPVSSPRDREPIDATMDLDNNAQNGHRSLVATATLTQSMISPQQTTISPVSSIPTLIHQQQSIAVSQQQPQLFSAPPPGLGQGQLQSHHNPQFGAFTPAGQQQQNSLPPIGLPPPLHHHHHHFPPNRHAHPTALLQQHAAAMAQINALHAAAAVVHQTSNVTNNIGPPPCTPPINPQSTSIYDGMSSLLKSQSQQPPPQQHNQSNHQQQITYQKSGQIVIGQHQQIPMGRVLYTMTCETAALASVGAAAVTAGYHVTLEPCASAPPIIPLPAAGVVDGAIDDVQQSAAGDNNNLPSSPPTCSSSRHQQCTPPPGFRQQQAAVPNEDGRSGANGPSNDANNQQHAAGDQNGRGSMNDSTSGNADNGQQQQMNNGPAHPDIINNIMPPGVPPEIAAAISGGHDLFVHIHPGDAIALAVGNEIQHIHGPATIRMVSQSTPPSAIPMNIPQGHVVQQLLDRQGYLSHIIMSQEMPPSVTAAVRTTPSGMTTASQQQQGGGQMQIPTTDHQQYRQSQSQNLLQPHHRPGQQQPSPQKSSTTGGRYRPSPSSSASPPNIASQLLQQQQFVLPPGGGGDQCQQMQNQPQQFTGDAGYGVHPNPLNKWTPRGTGQFQQYGGGGHRRGGHHQQQQHIPGPSNALGTFYIEPASQQLLAAATGQTPAQIANQFGQQQILLEQQQQQSSDYTIHQQQFAVSTATGGAPQIPILAPSAPYGGSPNIGTITSAEAGTGICIEDDEKERLRDALSSLQPPMVTRVGNRDADVVWQELDTSEAAASVPGFPEINQSEFVYQLILYEQNSSTSVCYKTDANSGNVLHLQRLRPATEYMICIRADLPGYNITGHPSAYTAFRTHSSRPDPPVMPKLISRQATACTLQWRASNCNGSSIVAYCLQMAKSKAGTFETVYEGLLEQTTINGLEPGGLYRFRLYCRNEIGQSDYSHQLNVYPERGGGNNYHQQQPTTHFIGAKGQSSITSSPCPSSIHNVIPKPHAPTVLSVTAKTAKLCWNGVQPGNDYINVSLEMSEISMRGGNTNSHFMPIPSDFYASSGTFANITGLQNNREYRFRLAVTTIHGEQIYSDTISLHTRTTHNYEHQQHEEHNEKHATTVEPTGEQQHRSPSTTQTKIVSQQKKSLSGPSQQKQQPLKTQQQQKITTTQSSQNQKHPIEETPERQQIQIAHKQPAQLQQQPLTTQKIPPICSTPKFAGITCENAKISWRMMPSAAANANPNNTEIQNTAMLFELQRVDRQQPQIVYSGNEMEFELKGLKPVEHLQLRVRAVWLDTEGKRFESDWSQVGSACTLSAPPSVPRNVRQIEPDSHSGGSAASTTEEMMESRSKKSSISHHGGGLGHHITHGHSIEICWDPPAQLNGASIIEYTIHAQRFPLGETSVNEKPFEERQIGSSTETQFQTPRLHPAQQYLFTVCAHNEAGASEKSEPYEYNSPPGVPDPPRDFHAQPLSTSELQLSWTEPTSNNGAIITSYHLNCYKLYNTRQQMDSSAFSLPPNSSSHNSGRQRQLVSQQIVPSSQRLLLVQSLETETDYELVLQAENSIGKGSREVIRCATLAEPPTPPELHLAQATANTLKLKWNPTGDILPTSVNHNYYYYYLERENENGTYSPVYEGDLRSTKVKGLRERSTHHFRIRAAIAKGLMIGPWSKRYSFQTTRQPPPAPKQAPIAIELSTDLFQLEWNAVRCKDSSIGDDQNEQQQQYVNQLQSQQQQFIYRLQIAPKVASSAKEKSIVEVWKTIYEGTSTQVTVPLPNASQQTRQARLFVVQQFLGADGQLMDECVSAPSPITLFCTQKTPNESPKKRPLAGGPSTSGTGRGRQQQAAVHYPTQKEPKVSMYKRLKRFGSWIKKTVSEKDCALVVLFFFVLLAFGIAILLNHYYLN